MLTEVKNMEELLAITKVLGEENERSLASQNCCIEKGQKVLSQNCLFFRYKE